MSQLLPYADTNFHNTVSLQKLLSAPNNHDSRYVLEFEL